MYDIISQTPDSLAVANLPPALSSGDNDPDLVLVTMQINSLSYSRQYHAAGWSAHAL